ncbi:hypothetical protein PIB30_064671 [Stylosanthes scabra]|uniref:AT-hook motif nuclear-localized protein n=1 Tax=Stylosanthes scabra TaxID=79078 RepID=A0ABU6TP62_9FABA|nr:hypothetical protein [Stylosanthes scabra]
MVESHEEQTQEEPFQNHVEDPALARIVTDTDLPQTLASPSGHMARDGGRGRGAATRGRGKPRKNTGIPLNLDPEPHPATSTPTTTTTTATYTTTPPVVATSGPSAGLPHMVMIPTPGSRVQ